MVNDYKMDALQLRGRTEQRLEYRLKELLLEQADLDTIVHLTTIDEEAGFLSDLINLLAEAAGLDDEPEEQDDTDNKTREISITIGEVIEALAKLDKRYAEKMLTFIKNGLPYARLGRLEDYNERAAGQDSPQE